MNNFKDGGFNKRGKDFGGKPKYQGDRKDNNRLGGSKFSGQRSGGKTSETLRQSVQSVKNRVPYISTQRRKTSILQ